MNISQLNEKMEGEAVRMSGEKARNNNQHALQNEK